MLAHRVNGNPPDSPLFMSLRGERLSASATQGLFKGYLKKAGIDPGKFHIHSLRHTFATMIYKKTKDLRLTQDLLGHSSANTTARYAHVGDVQKKAAVADLY